MKDRNELSRSGIYQIMCTANNKKYIGSAIKINLRKNRHFHHLVNGSHFSPNLQNSYNKYGPEFIEFSVLEFCDTGDLLSREQYYFDLLKPEFNSRADAKSNIGCKQTKESIDKQIKTKIKNGAYERVAELTRQRSLGNKNMLGKKHSKETKELISNKLKDRKLTNQQKERMRIVSTGRKHTVESREKMSKIAMGNKKGAGHLVTEEHKNKLRTLRSIKVSQFSLDGEFIKEWPSGKQAAIELGLNQANINSCTNGKRKQSGGFLWIKK